MSLALTVTVQVQVGRQFDVPRLGAIRTPLRTLTPVIVTYERKLRTGVKLHVPSCGLHIPDTDWLNLPNSAAKSLPLVAEFVEIIKSTSGFRWHDIVAARMPDSELIDFSGQ